MDSAAPAHNPCVLVTGGARGIGAATVLRCAKAGFDVGVNYRRDADAAAQVVAQVEALGRRALALQADVADEAQLLAMFARIDAELGPLRGLVNNAGIVAANARVDSIDVARLQRIFVTNIIGPFVCAREAVRRMSTRHGGAGGAIVNISSKAAVLGAADWYVDYAASKAAIETMTIGLAREVAQEGIRVNAVRPGIVDTGIHASAGAPQRAFESNALIPMQRPARADEIAAAIVWLLGDDAGYVTGAVLDVTGGR